MAKIFLCYRREDSRWPTQWIYNDLVDHFGSESVVWDIDSIPYGVDFREYLNKEVSKCDILLAVIGDKWLEIFKQRLDQPNDFVRIEIQAALKRGIPVVPILVGEKSVPSEKDLPPELANLSYKQAAEVRAGADLKSHLKRLVDGLDRLFSESKVGEDIKQKQIDKELKREESPKKITNSIGMEFVLIPAGSFLMGSLFSPKEVAKVYGGKAEDYKDERPQHHVEITKPFYLQTTQVSQTQWKKVMSNNPSHFRDFGYNCPVDSVSWYDTQEFISKLNQTEGTNKYRLPTEAEWEYSCRAGTTTAFSFGNEVDKLGEYAWHGYNSDLKTHPVGKKKPNAWDLYDMHGNVFEWCLDCYRKYTSKSVVDPEGAKKGQHLVTRGGACGNKASTLRSASRTRQFPHRIFMHLGFRVARDL